MSDIKDKISAILDNSQNASDAAIIIIDALMLYRPNSIDVEEWQNFIVSYANECFAEKGFHQYG